MTTILGKFLGYAILAIILPLFLLSFLFLVAAEAAVWFWRWHDDPASQPQ